MSKPLPEISQHESNNEYVTAQINRINGSRLAWVVPIFVVVHLAHFAAFWPYTPGVVATRDLWRNGVIVLHATILGLVVPTFLIKMLLERSGRFGKVVTALNELVGLVYIIGGAALAIGDQRVTTSITPFFISAIGVALVVVIRPFVALGIYALDLSFFAFGLAWTQTNPDILLTNRINSVSAAALGFGLAFLQWRNQRVTLAQKRQIAEQQRELEAKNRELTLLATTDALTGLLNRGQFLSEAQREVLRMQEMGNPASLIMMDIDHFKDVNDTYGHPVGDAILVEVAGVVRQVLGGVGLLSRLGGEEFAILLPACSLLEAVPVAERLRAAIAAHVFSACGRSVRVTCSFGVAQIRGPHETLDGCYRSADAALYQAKHDGRNCVKLARECSESAFVM